MFIKLNELDCLKEVNYEIFSNSKEVEQNLNGIVFFLDIFDGKLYTAFTISKDYPDKKFYYLLDYAHKAIPEKKLLKIFPYVELTDRSDRYVDDKLDYYLLSGKDDDVESRYTNIFTINRLYREEEEKLKLVSKELRKELEQHALERFEKFWVNKYNIHEIKYFKQILQFYIKRLPSVSFHPH